MKTWSFLSNPFLNATTNSYRAMQKIAAFTLAVLDAKKANAFFNSLLAALQPSATNFSSAYTDWLSQLGMQQGTTMSLANLLAQLASEKIDDWDIAVQGVYKSSTAAYKALFPYHRTPFQHGSQNDRMAAMAALSKAIGTDAALQAIKLEIDDFYTELVKAYNTQKGSLSATGSNSDAVEAARIEVGVQLYGVLGILMDHFKTNPTEVEVFFDLQTIRNHEQTTFKHDIAAAATINAMTHTFAPGDELRLQNRGASELHFALVKEATDSVCNFC